MLKVGEKDQLKVSVKVLSSHDRLILRVVSHDILVATKSLRDLLPELDEAISRSFFVGVEISIKCHHLLGDGVERELTFLAVFKKWKSMLVFPHVEVVHGDTKASFLQRRDHKVKPRLDAVLRIILQNWFDIVIGHAISTQGS